MYSNKWIKGGMAIGALALLFTFFKTTQTGSTVFAHVFGEDAERALIGKRSDALIREAGLRVHAADSAKKEDSEKTDSREKASSSVESAEGADAAVSRRAASLGSAPSTVEPSFGNLNGTTASTSSADITGAAGSSSGTIVTDSKTNGLRPLASPSASYTGKESAISGSLAMKAPTAAPSAGAQATKGNPMAAGGAGITVAGATSPTGNLGAGAATSSSDKAGKSMNGYAGTKNGPTGEGSRDTSGGGNGDPSGRASSANERFNNVAGSAQGNNWKVDIIGPMGNASTQPRLQGQAKEVQNHAETTSEALGNRTFQYYLGENKSAKMLNPGTFEAGALVGIEAKAGRVLNLGEIQMPERGDNANALSLSVRNLTTGEHQWDVVDQDGNSRLGNTLTLNASAQGNIQSQDVPLPNVQEVTQVTVCCRLHSACAPPPRDGLVASLPEGLQFMATLVPHQRNSLDQNTNFNDQTPGRSNGRHQGAMLREIQKSSPTDIFTGWTRGFMSQVRKGISG